MLNFVTDIYVFSKKVKGHIKVFHQGKHVQFIKVLH